MPNLIPIFLTGLLAGGITCAAVQGGLLIALIGTAKATDPDRLAKPNKTMRLRLISIVFLFVGAKLASHTVLGFFLGLIGEKLQLSVQFTSIMLGLASLFMIGLALNMLSVHPFFRRFAISSPRFFRMMLWKQSKRQDLFAPLVLGALTIVIPCGVTQSMMAEAIASGNPLSGALIMMSFILGTAPLFILIGLAVTVLTEAWKVWFERGAAILIIIMALWNLANVSALLGIDTKVRLAMRPITCQFVYCEESGQSSVISFQTTKNPTITIRSAKYEIDNPNIRGGEGITLTVTNKDGYGCIQYFTIPALGIQKAIPVGTSATITFTAPIGKGELAYTCSMGMYRGKFVVR